MLIYDSFKNSYEILINKKFNIKNDENTSCVSQKILYTQNLLIQDKKEYIEISLFYDNNLSLEKINKIYQILLDKDNKLKYKKYLYFNCFLIYPNKNDENFYIEIKDFSDINLIKNNNYYIFNIPIKKSNIEIYFDGMVSNQIENLELFFNRKILQEDEKDFIINNYQQQKINKNNKNKKNKANKDIENYKDFMGKDPSLAKFKITEEESKIFSPNTLKIIDGSKNPNKDINKLIGLDNVKLELQKLNAKLDYRIKRESRNIYDTTIENLHMCFYGNPGTGKTTVARIMTGLLYNMGYIKKNKCIEINANEMKGTAIGQTAVKTKIILRNAKNKVLFIDEAYALCDGVGGYGQEAIDTIVKEMEDNKHNLVIIFAGYQKEMQDFISANEGLKSRINRYIYFKNYNIIELCKIFTNMVHSQGLTITTDAMCKTVEIFKEISFQKNFSNGRFVRNYFEEIEEEHAFNTTGITDENILYTLTSNDISDDIINQFIMQNKSR